MSCYFRHLNNIFKEAGIEVTPENKKQLDKAIHRIVEVNYKDCPRSWKTIKNEILSDEQKRHDFIIKLQSALKHAG